MLSFVAILSGCAGHQVSYTTPSLPIFGDIPIGTAVETLEELISLSAEHHVNRLLIVTSDKVAVEIDIESLSYITLVYEDERWHTRTEELPITANLKDVVYIAVESAYNKNRLALFRGTDHQKHISPYSFLKRHFMIEGSSGKSKHKITKYNFHEVPSYDIDFSEDLWAVVEHAEKSHLPTFLHVHRDNLSTNIHTEATIYSPHILSFAKSHWETAGKHTRIIWDTPPDMRYEHLIDRMYEHNFAIEPQLVILIDGYGYQMMQNARSNGISVYLTIDDFLPFVTVYPPTTLSFLKPLVDWGMPIDADTQPNVLFGSLTADRGVILENDVFLFAADYPIILHKSDEEIYSTAITILDDGYDFIFVHFHSIDDVAHEYGPYSSEVLAQIKIVSEMVESIVEKADRQTLILSDHGLHPVGAGGSHGSNHIEDMVGVYKWINLKQE
jgi:hypothetical protein